MVTRVFGAKWSRPGAEFQENCKLAVHGFVNRHSESGIIRGCGDSLPPCVMSEASGQTWSNVAVSNPIEQSGDHARRDESQGEIGSSHCLWAGTAVGDNFFVCRHTGLLAGL